MSKFTESKNSFDLKYKNASNLDSFVSVHLNSNANCNIKDKNYKSNEEYYKWQLVYTLVNSGLIPNEYIGTEVYFPKGNKNSAPIKLDIAIFDDTNWFKHYESYHSKNDLDSLSWLREHLIMPIEIKNENGNNVLEVWDKQLKSYMKESERKICFGALYDTERLYLFKKINGKFIRLNDEYNEKKEKSNSKELSLQLTDSYNNFPSIDKLKDWDNNLKIDRSKRTIYDLDVISGVHSQQINTAMSHILRTMDKQGLVNQKGYEILLQIISLKIYDEKRNEKFGTSLDFYIADEVQSLTLADPLIQEFINRIESIKEEAEGKYYRILSEWSFNRKNEGHVKVLFEMVKQFQDYSFVLSTKTDLYQLVFYTFASQFSKNENAQFVTPLPVIEFLVNIVNPRNQETVIDPTVGIADFLSVSYVNSKSKLDDNNIFGFDNDTDMVKLATLNMLLNGDGNAKILSKPNLGSIDTKFSNNGNLIELDPTTNKNGNWDSRTDSEKLLKFDVVLTNPPFGEDRAFEPRDTYEKEIISCYELWNKYNSTKIDLGVIFLENAFRILKENGRMGIVLSNSIASIDSHRMAREWLMDNMRIVAIFDLPAGVFAETGVNTTLIVAYKPSKSRLSELQNKNYEVFFRNIENVGYEVKTKKRVKVFEPVYDIDYNNFQVIMDENGSPLLDEDFTETVKDFKQWALSQETELIDLFVKEK
ncbi:HsdM family class I SAM-dependent methyltransferase [Peptoniphilus raoultii]|uniref:HsdM family class I SAM-dependent methyltransferase n=1 Tax=Peptoniphilus raoultii TaxID=1776387 RepID=UPI0008DA1400|nr:N-6 DNA methylase [Peptoniphilus raoultii]